MRMAWQNVYERVNGKLVQIDVMPRRDARRHVRGAKCWCKPTQEQVEQAVMFGHVAADGRHLVETQGVN